MSTEHRTVEVRTLEDMVELAVWTHTTMLDDETDPQETNVARGID